MIICPRCDMEYDNGEEVCGACGSPLVVREDPTLESIHGTVDPGKRELRRCPKCNLLYEKQTHCMSCGTALVAAQGPSLAKKEIPKAIDQTSHKESSSVPISRKQPEKPREETVCGYGRVTRELPDRQETPRPAREPQVKNRNYGRDLQKILEGVYSPAGQRQGFIPRPFLVGAVVLLALVVGYFPLKRVMLAGPTEAPVTSPIHTVSSPRTEMGTAARTVASTEEQETEKIRGLLENIRQANLREDIDLFMSCYADDFKEREEKKRSILESWKNSDYLDLSYSLKSKALTVDTAKIQVEWLIRTARSVTGQLEKGQLLVEALLKKESGFWKIKEIKTLS
jgi:hypothetical protein